MHQLFSRRGIDRRRFLGGAVAPLALTATGVIIPSWMRAYARGTARVRAGAKAAFDENLYWAFVPIKDPELGESDEFTTINNVDRLLAERGVPDGTTIIGIGARSGTPDDPYGQPGEMGYVRTYGKPWAGSVTSTGDASPVPLGDDDPIAVTQVGVLSEATAHRFEIDDPSLAGSVLWTFHQDDTEKTIFRRGLHNSFNDVDGGATDTLFELARQAHADPEGWEGPFARGRLAKVFPRLLDDRIWGNFAPTFGRGILYQQWLPYIRQQGWQGAAIVLRGSVMNVNQFHLWQWNAKSPQDPLYEPFKGTHPPLAIRYGREVRPFVDTDTAEWSMAGFIWDLANEQAQPPMMQWNQDSDIFGQPFHIHGFRDDRKHGGHTLLCMLGETGKLSVSLYPLRFVQGQSAALFNNDLLVVAGSALQDSDGLSVTVKNDGENFARNVRVDLTDGNATETVVLPLLSPREARVVRFSGALARGGGARRVLVDPEGHFMEGGAGRSNNSMEV